MTYILLRRSITKQKDAYCLRTENESRLHVQKHKETKIKAARKITQEIKNTFE